MRGWLRKRGRLDGGGRREERKERGFKFPLLFFFLAVALRRGRGRKGALRRGKGREGKGGEGREGYSMPFNHAPNIPRRKERRRSMGASQPSVLQFVPYFFVLLLLSPPPHYHHPKGIKEVGSVTFTRLVGPTST